MHSQVQIRRVCFHLIEQINFYSGLLSSLKSMCMREETYAISIDKICYCQAAQTEQVDSEIDREKNSGTTRDLNS